VLQIGLGFLVANQHRQDGSSATNASPDEAWIVLEAGTESHIYAGLKPGTTRDDLRRELANGTAEDLLLCFTPKPDDGVFIPGGDGSRFGQRPRSIRDSAELAM
jgi:hypothetical protein